VTVAWSAGQNEAVLAELVAARLALRRYGTLVNQAVAALHSGQQAPLWLRQALSGADSAVARVDMATARLARGLAWPGLRGGDPVIGQVLPRGSSARGLLYYLFTEGLAGEKGLDAEHRDARVIAGWDPHDALAALQPPRTEGGGRDFRQVAGQLDVAPARSRTSTPRPGRCVAPGSSPTAHRAHSPRRA